MLSYADVAPRRHGAPPPLYQGASHNFHTTGGKGFIALAAMIFGNWNPLGTLAGALLFGFTDALQIKLQIAGIEVPYQFLGMLPYLVTMIVLAGVVGRARPPAASGRPYRRDTAAL